MSADKSQPQNDIDLSVLASALRRRAGWLAISALAVGALTYGGLLMVPSRFHSEAQIRIGSPSMGDTLRGAGGNQESAALRIDREAIASRVHELRSPDLARKLAKELRFNLKPEFNSALDNQGLFGGLLRMAGLAGPRPGETEEERVLAAYYKALEVYQVKDTRVITLGFTARDGDLAATAANRLVELYQDWLRQQGVSDTADASAWLVPEIEKRTRELNVAEAEVERFRTTANLFRGGGSQPSGLAEQQLTDIATELTKVRAQRSEAQARAQTARELIGRGLPDAIPEVQRSPVIQGLVAQRVKAERDLAEATTQLLPAHPRMKQLNANVADARRQVQREAGTIVDGLEREVKALSLREELARRTLEDAKSKVGDKAGDRVRLAQLEDEAKAKRRELEALRGRFEAARSRGTINSVPVEVQVIATALPSSRPSWPNRGQISALAAAATFVLGLVAVLFRELLVGGGRRVADRQAGRSPPLMAPSRRHTDEPVPDITPASKAAVVERPPADRPAAIPPSVAAPTTLSSIRSRRANATGPDERVASIVGRLICNASGPGGYRTLVVGETEDVDARDLAVSIAMGLSSAGRQVVLVDWSLDGHGISEGLGIPGRPGFSDLLAGNVTFEDVIRVMPDGHVHLLPCGAARVEASGPIDPDRLNLLLDALDEAYSDLVITGRYGDIRTLFRTIEGRVDAGVAMKGPAVPEAGHDEGSQRFLGFDVTEIDVIRIDPDRAPAQPHRKEAVRLPRGSAATTATG
jgi:uncharacterized protein involved in exopolysaccharide biosynthesis/Mrp family chromosome partitioning ATPase